MSGYTHLLRLHSTTNKSPNKRFYHMEIARDRNFPAGSRDFLDPGNRKPLIIKTLRLGKTRTSSYTDRK
jgi:hypothetical protein